MVTLLLSSSGIMAQFIVKVKPQRPSVVIVNPTKTYKNKIWIEGHWRWDKQVKNYQWTKGRWTRAKTNRTWRAGKWKKIPAGWKYVPGHWAKG